MRIPALAFALFATGIHAETIRVYREERVETPEHVRSKLTGEPSRWTAKGEFVGQIDLGDLTLDGIIADYCERSWKDEPFYGPVEKFVFEDSKGRVYVAHLEYVKDSKLLGEGRRVAVKRLEKVRRRKDRFTGSPYGGSSIFDDTLLKGLRTLVVK
ncbi:hypothetical protein [Haloferula sargassicola]